MAKPSAGKTAHSLRKIDLDCYELAAEVVEGIGFTELEAALRGRKLLKSQRKGKHMWLEFDSGPALMLHFGEQFRKPLQSACGPLQHCHQMSVLSSSSACAQETNIVVAKRRVHGLQ